MQPEKPAAPLAGAARSGVCVAVVDDDPHILDVLSAWLHSLGIQPWVFESAEELLAAVRLPQAQPRPLAGAILDINLKAMHGLELAHQLRQAYPHIPLVMISALQPDEVARLGSLPARARCLRKPFDLDALENALFEWIH